MSRSELTKEILKKVRQVEIRSRRFVDESLVGAYHSVFKGTGMDFAEVREYCPGDDVRSIDWNVTARMDRPFIKVFEEERELTIVLAVDLSGSGDFGSLDASKRELAAELASVLAFSATRNNDKIGLLLFTDEVETFIPPGKGRSHILRVIREVLFFEPKKKGTDIPLALKTLNRVIRRKAIVFLLSDFLTEDSLAWIRPSASKKDDLHSTIRLTHRRHDLICVDLFDPRELELTDVGIVLLEDAETGEQIELDTGNAQLRMLYAQKNKQRRDNLHENFKRSGVDHFSVSTDEPYIHALRSFFKRRGGRR
jgi:uncharacterized protein (DUF58 family)|tara:strand:- start:123620 stop:124549 length:930 start_codon:yes stop_codon:yes gene_type:complete